MEVCDARPGEPDDAALEALLRTVYVDGGFTPPELAPTLLSASAVRARGQLLVALEGGKLLGTLIVVPPGAPARRIAQGGEAELHLLAVSTEARGRGVGAALVTAALARLDREHLSAVLWTQPTMTAAQRLYERAGFTRAPTRDAEIEALTRRRFLVYERPRR